MHDRGFVRITCGYYGWQRLVVTLIKKYPDLFWILINNSWQEN